MKVEKMIDFFTDVLFVWPYDLVAAIKNKIIRAILSFPAIILSIISLAIFGLPFLLMVIISGIVDITNNDF